MSMIEKYRKKCIGICDCNFSDFTPDVNAPKYRARKNDVGQTMIALLLFTRTICLLLSLVVSVL